MSGILKEQVLRSHTCERSPANKNHVKGPRVRTTSPVRASHCLVEPIAGIPSQNVAGKIRVLRGWARHGALRSLRDGGKERTASGCSLQGEKSVVERRFITGSTQRTGGLCCAACPTRSACPFSDCSNDT